MDTPTFPNIPDAMLVPFRAIDAQLTTWPDLLDRPDCPYSPATKRMLKRLCAAGVEAEEIGAFSEDQLLEETSKLYRDLQKMTSTVVMNDPKDKVSVYKTSADLLTKLTTLLEKQMSIREMSRFQKVVLEVLETVVTPAQRSEFMEKMAAYV